MLPTSAVTAPGIQGAGVIGVQGIGVRTPSAAAVAAATAGFARLLHMPKGSTLRNGLLSMMFATGIDDMTRLSGTTISVDGASPIVHIVAAPPQASRAIVRTSRTRC